MTKILIVAFDGLDYELIREYGLTHIPQEEFGRIDNDTDIYRRMTSELFASFLTGETWHKHGVKGLTRWNSGLLNKFEDWAIQYRFFQKFAGLRGSIYNFLGFSQKEYLKEDYRQPTFLDKVTDSTEIDVPTYSPPFSKGQKLLGSYGINAAVRQQNAIFEYKKSKLFEALRNQPPLIMAHFHKVDHYHHWFWEIGDEEKIRSIYKEIDLLSKEILDKAGAYDITLFMSDHGLPVGEQHNQNAFYSSNKQLFGRKTPHITDFHDVILNQIQNSHKKDEELSNLSI